MATASLTRARKIRVNVGMKISFTYRKLNGDMRDVQNFVVDNIYVSKKGHRIIQGIREDGSGHTYRRDRMTNVKEIE